MSESQTATEISLKKSPLTYFFGQPLESFDKLLEVQPSTSANLSNVKPTDFDIIRHWMYLEDQNRKLKSNLNSVDTLTNNLVAFYTKYHPSVELRYVQQSSGYVM